MKKINVLAVIVLSVLGLSCNQNQEEKKTTSAEEKSNTTTTKTDTMSTENGYIFELNDEVTRTSVNFKNRYGITLAGDLYLPKNAGDKKLPALAISGPFGAVKEQASGLYANEFAKRGYAVVTFDPSYTGESEGEPRNTASPDINTEDFSAAIDFLGIQDNIDREKIGIIGICGFGGFALNAVAADKRVKAVATTSMYNMSRVNAKGYFDSTTPEQRAEQLEQMSLQLKMVSFFQLAIIR